MIQSTRRTLAQNIVSDIMTEAYEDYLDSQKTVYVLDTETLPERIYDTGLYYTSEVKEEVNDAHLNVPLGRLLQGHEPIDHMKLRYKMFLEQASFYEDFIAQFVESYQANDTSHKSIYDFFYGSKENDEEDGTSAASLSFLKGDERIETCLLNLGPNLSNHNFLITSICENLNELSSQSIDFVRLDSISCFTVKLAIKSLITQLYAHLLGPGYASRSQVKKERNDEDEDNDEDDEESAADGLPSVSKADIDYIISLQAQRNRPLVIVVDDADSFASSILITMLKLAVSFSSKLDIKIMLGISTPFLVFQEKIPKLLIKDLNCRLFDIDKSKVMLLRLMENIVFNTKSDLIFHPRLIEYFQDLRSANGLNLIQFMNQVKYVIMTHFYQQPLCILMGGDLDIIDENYAKILKKLPSVKAHSQVLLSENELDYDLDIEAIEERDRFIKTIYKEDSTLDDLKTLVHESMNKLKAWKPYMTVMIDLLQFTQEFFISDAGTSPIWNDKMDIYCTVTDKDQLEIMCLSKLWEMLDNSDYESITLYVEAITEGGDWKLITDEAINAEYLPLTLENYKDFLKSFTRRIEIMIYSLRLSNIPFYEISILSNVELLKNVFNPSPRHLITESMTNSKRFLFNPIHTKEIDPIQLELYKHIQPSLVEIFSMYREATITVNLFDLYTAFKANLNKDKIIPLLKQVVTDFDGEISYNNKNAAVTDIDSIKADMMKILNSVKVHDKGMTKGVDADGDAEMEEDMQRDNSDEEEDIGWDSLILSWFLQSVVELGLIGFVKDGKARSESIEKLVWKDL